MIKRKFANMNWKDNIPCINTVEKIHKAIINPKHKLIFQLVSMGLSAKQVGSLRVSDIELEFIRCGTFKLPIDKTTRVQLLDIAKGVYIFGGNQPFTKRSVELIITKAGELHNIRLTAHYLRHCKL